MWKVWSGLHFKGSPKKDFVESPLYSSPGTIVLSYEHFHHTSVLSLSSFSLS
uniref:Uncharacterized protein n=1 Tax=Anguilla anguilla TaxID=7936 RepID=A0A0E9ULR5_ANGAN